MFNTANFKTQTNYMDYASPALDDVWVIGLDIGYSAIKGMSANKVFCFPAYANPISERESISDDENNFIKYRDEEGNLWVVGELAYKEIKNMDVPQSDKELFNRNRYLSAMYKVMANVGYALGMQKNSFGSYEGKEIVIQAGLPPRYLESDTDIVKTVLSGRRKFEVKFGKNPWQSFDFEIKKDNVYVMSQPLGAYISALIDKNGKPTDDSRIIRKSSVVIADPGFGTFDVYNIDCGSVVSTETFNFLGMHEIFNRTCKDIKDINGVNISVPELQLYLNKGTIRYNVTNSSSNTDRLAALINRGKQEELDFSNTLKNHCENVCIQALEKMYDLYNNFLDIDYLIVTGGTYDAWKETFDTVFNNSSLKVTLVPANRSVPNLSNVFSNVRGYYFQRINLLKKKG